MKGSANAAWNGAVKPSGPIKKYGDRVKNRRGGAPGGARAGHTASGTSIRCQFVTEAPDRRSAPSRMRGKKKCKGVRLAPALKRPMAHACMAAPNETRKRGLFDM